jgi:hypothetical protein
VRRTDSAQSLGNICVPWWPRRWLYQLGAAVKSHAQYQFNGTLQEEASGSTA